MFVRYPKRNAFLRHKVSESESQSCPTLCDPIQSVGFSRPEHWSGQPFPSPGDLPNPGIKPRSPVLQVDALPNELPGKPKESISWMISIIIFLHQRSLGRITFLCSYYSPEPKHIVSNHHELTSSPSSGMKNLRLIQLKRQNEDPNPHFLSPEPELSSYGSPDFLLSHLFPLALTCLSSPAKF